MQTADVSSYMAVFWGMVSFFSPCVFAMIPIYIMYITGVYAEDSLKNKKKLALKRTLLFVAGFTTVFVIMGTTATYIGRFFSANKEILGKISGVLIVLFGLNMTGLLRLNFLSSEKKLFIPKTKNTPLGSYFMGVAFAGGWTPCFGPILASILLMASNSNTVYRGMFLLFLYSVGMGIPFVLTALFMESVMKFFHKKAKFFDKLPVISGVILIIFGVIVFFGGLNRFTSGL